MRWEDERYVRVYTRDTGDWLELSFEAQALFLMLLRKVDRIGELRLGKRGRAAVAALVGHPDRAAALAPALGLLLADGCVGLRDDGQVLVIPNYLKAQETPKTPSERKRLQRERDAEASAQQSRESRSVTDSHEMSRESREAVTRHEMSLHTMPSVPCRAEPPVPYAAAVPAPEGVTATPAARVELAYEADSLDERLKRVWREERGSDMDWKQRRDGEAMREVLRLARDDWAEAERVWRRALRMPFPMCLGLRTLVEHWPTYAGRDPPKAAGRGRATEADKDWSGPPPELLPNGDVAL